MSGSFYCPRAIEQTFTDHASHQVAILEGRRAIGKSTLARHLVETGIYASYQTLADPTERANAAADPTRWLASLDFPAIIDEAQLVPDLSLAVKARGLPPTGTSRVAHGFGLRGPRAAGGLRPLGRPRDKNAASPFQRSRGLAPGGNGCALSRRSSFRRPVGLGHTGTRLNSRAHTPLEDRRRSQLLPEHGSADH